VGLYVYVLGSVRMRVLLCVSIEFCQQVFAYVALCLFCSTCPYAYISVAVYQNVLACVIVCIYCSMCPYLNACVIVCLVYVHHHVCVYVRAIVYVVL
jgi:hypothetical protein